MTLWNHDQVDVSSLPSISITLGQYYTSHALLQRPWFQDMWVWKKTVIPWCEVWSWDLHLQNRVSHLGAIEPGFAAPSRWYQSGNTAWGLGSYLTAWQDSSLLEREGLLLFNFPWNIFFFIIVFSPWRKSRQKGFKCTWTNLELLIWKHLRE